MATMVPARIQFRDSRAEERLFAAFRDNLAAKFTAIHHVPWVLSDSRRRSIEGEADFVVVHPDLGALVLEVKGGTLRYDGQTSKWYQRSAGADDEHLIKDPFRQAADGARAIVRHLESSRGWRRGWGPIGYGVCFPDATFGSDPLPAIRPELIIDGLALGSPGGIERRVREVMAYFPRAAFVQGEHGATALIRALNHDLTITQPLGLAAADVERSILELSEQQYRILRLLRHRRRLAIRGPAGSGKTLLALEHARELARTGNRTLLLCYNRPLADHLRATGPPDPSLEILTFHQLCHRLAELASIDVPAGQDFFDKAAELALRAIDVIGSQYDAILVDEGQVIDEDWWFPIEALLRDGTDGVLWIFYDDNQALYDRPRGLPDGLETQPLMEVWRNSRPIFDEVIAHYQGDDEVACLGPEGPAVERVDARGNVRRELGRVLHRLINDEHVRPEDVVVLTPRAVAASGITGQVGAFIVTDAPTRRNDIRLSSIYRFLGLEAGAVVLCEIAGDAKERRRLMYVAMSRARALLVLIE
jgi:hypothetical protein